MSLLSGAMHDERSPDPRPPQGDDDAPTTPAGEADTHADASKAASPPDVETQIGPYRLLQKIGEGGMGEVWAAEQQHPVRRRVALKIIKRGMDTRKVVARFEAERQALALMNHANVARVFDAGETPRGRPYFAMEYVKGSPITRYCDRQRLTTRARLELMIQVCEGIQHAHQKGIIHRDLKPSNILVSVEEGSTPTPKIIDFGVAKATNQTLTERTLFTEMGQMIGTPEYMSPEQAEVTGEDVDTRTDIYSLGVVLYELLTGALPFDSRELRSAGPLEIQRRIRDDEPPRPSTRVSSLGPDSARVAERRQTYAPQLVRRLKGDLDWITMKAMEKDRTRRYSSPAELAADLRRHLDREPVLAASPSVGYRLGKFVARNKAGVAVGAVLVVALLVGIAGLAAGLLRAQRAEERAVTERDRATQSQEELGEVVEFLVDLFKVADPGERTGETMTAREILDRGADRLRTELHDRPLTRARMLDTLGDVYQSLGLYDVAREQMEESLELVEQETGSESPETAAVLLGLSSLEGGRANFDVSEAMARRALEIYQRVYAGDHEEVSWALRAVALAVSRGGDHEAAEPLYREALEMARRLPDAGDRLLEAQVRGHANVLSDLGRDEEAGPLYEESLALCRKIWGGDNINVAFALDNLAIHHDYAERPEQAEPLYRESLEMLERLYGEDHPEVAQTMGNLAAFLVTWADPEAEDFAAKAAEAEALATKAAEMHRQFRPDHPMIADNLSTLASLRSLQQDPVGAERFAREALAVYRIKLAEDHPRVVSESLRLAEYLLDQGRAAEVEPMLLEILAAREDPEDADRQKALELLAETYDALGREEEAAQIREQLEPQPPAELPSG